MHKLFLFDIDGTLVGGVGDSTLATTSTEDRFTQAINSGLGLNIKHKKDFRGLTDYLILKLLLEDEGWIAEQIESAMPELIKELNKVHEKTFRAEDITLLPGVKPLLVVLHQHHVKLGLITGNLKPVAKRKLEALGVWSYFSVGGFGDDPHVVRADLVKTAIKRAGFEDRMEDVYVIGDTPRDIEAAHQAGVQNSVGVANGYRDIQELKDADAKLIFEDFKDTDYTLKKLGVA
ncbi:MAG TPA: HAD family hydrolase [Candidatus Saccharimonadales bacterium]|nr:HAD family hydrolase [Candidatus Saccharimonadales bacterium]